MVEDKMIKIKKKVTLEYFFSYDHDSRNKELKISRWKPCNLKEIKYIYELNSYVSSNKKGKSIITFM